MGTHAFTETMNPFVPPIMRLIGSLHSGSDTPRKWWVIIAQGTRFCKVLPAMFANLPVLYSH